MKRWQAFTVGGVIVAATGTALALMFNADSSTAEAAPPEPFWEARTTQVSMGSYRPVMTLIGQIEAVKEHTEIAQQSAQVEQVFFKEGMAVEEGDLILALDDFDAQLLYQQATADLEELETQVALLESQHQLDLKALDVEKDQLALLQRQLTSQERVGTQQTIDDLKQQVQRQQFAVLQREAALANHPINQTQLTIQQQKLELAFASAQRQLEQTKLRAPFSGTLAQLPVQVGEYINPGAPLFYLYSDDALALTTQLPVQLLQEKTQLIGTIHEKNRISSVRYDRSEPLLQPDQSGFNAWFTIDNSQLWVPGDVAYLSLSLAPKSNTLRVPASAVFQDQWLYAVDEEQRLQAVQIDVLGSLSQRENTYLIVQPIDLAGQEIRLLTTRLNNPTTGMKIYEAGVDPEPVTDSSASTEADVNDEDA